jgi:hypothetical protein
MLPLNGHWIFICQQTEFHLKDGVCVCVYRPGGFFASHVALGWRALSVIGPPRSRGDDLIQAGDHLLLGKNGEIYYTPPIDEIKRARKKRLVFPRMNPGARHKDAPHPNTSRGDSGARHKESPIPKTLVGVRHKDESTPKHQEGSLEIMDAEHPCYE